jgi:hypothetical protein
MTKNRMATDDQPSTKELTKLLKRLEVVIPIVSGNRHHGLSRQRGRPRARAGNGGTREPAD